MSTKLSNGRFDFDGALVVLLFAAQFAVALLAIGDAVLDAPYERPIVAAAEAPAAP
jgi:hypothetical protein